MSDNFDQSVSLIGAGRVATSLGHALSANGVKVNEIYSRSLAQAKKLADSLSGTIATDSLDFSKSKSQILIIAISDDAIGQVSKNITFPEDIIIAHTSGTVSLDILQYARSGIFYPLQTFTENKKVDFRHVPILVDGKDDLMTNELMELGRVLSNDVQVTTESERQKLHLAAVFASNFTNRMLAAAEDILKDTSVDLKTLKPLVLESIQNAFDSTPDQALTGPAKRGDTKTIKKHMELLQENQELRSLYEAITKMITSKI